MTDKKKAFPLKLLKFAETYEVTPLLYVIIFLCISFTRNMFEGAFEYTHTIGTSAITAISVQQLLVLFNFEWITLLCAIAAALSVISGIKISTLLKLILFCYIWIISVPFLDLIIYRNYGCKINYLYTLKEYLRALALFFVPGTDVNVCAGIRIEVFFASVLSFLYIKHATRSLKKAVLSSLSLYFLAVSSMAYPVFILLPSYIFSGTGAFVNRFFFAPALIAQDLSRVSVMIYVLLIPVLLFIHRLHFGAEKNNSLLKGIFSPMAFLLSAVFAAGFAASTAQYAVFSNPFDWFILAASCLSLAIFCEYAFGTQLQKELQFIAPLISALFACAVSYHFMLVIIMMYAVSYLLKSPAYSGFYGPKSHWLHQLFAFTLAYMAGLSCVYGSNGLLQTDYIMLPILVAVMALATSAVLIKNSSLRNYLSIPVFIAYCVFAPATGFMWSFPASIIAGGLSAFVFYSGLNAEKKNSFLIIILAVFTLAAVISR